MYFESLLATKLNDLKDELLKAHRSALIDCAQAPEVQERITGNGLHENPRLVAWSQTADDGEDSQLEFSVGTYQSEQMEMNPSGEARTSIEDAPQRNSMDRLPQVPESEEISPPVPVGALPVLPSAQPSSPRSPHRESLMGRAKDHISSSTSSFSTSGFAAGHDLRRPPSLLNMTALQMHEVREILQEGQRSTVLGMAEGGSTRKSRASRRNCSQRLANPASPMNTMGMVMSSIAMPRGSEMMRARTQAKNTHFRNSSAPTKRKGGLSKIYEDVVLSPSKSVRWASTHKNTQSQASTLQGKFPSTLHKSSSNNFLPVSPQSSHKEYVSKRSSSGAPMVMSKSDKSEDQADVHSFGFCPSINSTPSGPKSARQSVVTESLPSSALTDKTTDRSCEDGDMEGTNRQRFSLASTWEQQPPRRQTTRMTLAASASQHSHVHETDSESSELQNATKEEGQRAQTGLHVNRLMMQPNSKSRVILDVTGFVFVTWDSIVLPLHFFNLEQNSFFKFMQWCMLWFWSINFIMSFFKGYHRADGMVEMRPSFTVVHYMVTWMIFDLAFVVVDWIDLATDYGQAVTIFSMVRLARLARLIRLIRSATVFQSLSLQLENFSSVLGFIALLLSIHIIACFWYGIGAGSISGDDNWVTYQDVATKSFFHRYIISVHWSLTQFSGGEMEVEPTNVIERSYVIVAQLFGFITAAYIVSIITTSMTRLQIVNARRATMISQLKKYLADNGISTKLALRVQRNAMHALTQEEKNTPEESVELLEYISEPLCIELHYEVNSPILKIHPLFFAMDKTTQFLKRICHVTLTRLSIYRGDVLFNEDEVPSVPLLYFVLGGMLHYEHRMAEDPITVQLGQWFCEAVLWTSWEHCGNMRAKMHCTLIGVQADNFIELSKKLRISDTPVGLYAREYVKKLGETDFDSLTDLDAFDIEDVVITLFGDNIF